MIQPIYIVVIIASIYFNFLKFSCRLNVFVKEKKRKNYEKKRENKNKHKFKKVSECERRKWKVMKLRRYI